MSDSQGGQSAVSRRFTKTYVRQDPQVELGNVSQGSISSSSSESKYGSTEDEGDEHEQFQRRRDYGASGSYAGTAEIITTTKSLALGRDLAYLFPSTADERNKSGMSFIVGVLISRPELNNS